MIKTVAPALKTLLDRLIDYAGLFPPAKLSLDHAIKDYNQYRTGEYSWMLRWFVVGEGDLERVPDALDGHMSVLAESGQSRAASIESKDIVLAKQPVYCEVALNKLGQLDAVKKSSCFAKVRTGGLKPEAIPSPKDVAEFILGCAERRLAFKATAGLHHPLRAEQALTYETDAPRAVMHGFLNVLMASAFAWQGERDIVPIISEMDAKAFSFDDRAHWRDKSLDQKQIQDARLNFMHSIGSCSFEEPVHDLRALGLL